jgi:P-type conjugative transfer protein TrbJ
MIIKYVKNLVASVCVVCMTFNSANAGIPTIDIAALAQSILQVLQMVQQYAQQIQQYQTQLQQYNNMLQNTTNAANFNWDQAKLTVNNIKAAVDTIQFYKNRLGSLQNYLDKFKDLEYYRTSPCFTSGGCTQAQLNALREQVKLASETSKKANDAMFNNLEKQQDAMEDEAQRLETLQTNAQSASGQLEAIQYANQLASHQANQLLQIRGLLVAQQNATAALQQAEIDRKAQQEAASELFRAKTFSSSPARVH